MRILQAIFVFVASFLIITSCQKEISEENGGGTSSIGTLKSSLTGDCLPSNLNGIFRTGVVLTNTNYIDVQVDVAAAGSYFIHSDTLNGYSFKAEGVFTATGLNTVRLTGTGTPASVGTNSFTIAYGSSICIRDVTVVSTTTTDATFTLAGSPNNCSGAILNGVFKAATVTNASNSVTLSVDVTATGTYAISAPAVNGVSFSGTGVFVNTGVQTVTLAASGTPSAAGTFNAAVNAGSSNCGFSFTVTSGGTGGTAAVFTLGGAGGACTGIVLSGTYMAGTAMSATNTATIDVNVTTIGTYNISTAAVNGVTFSKTGSFTATGAQTVTLTASGTPTAAGLNSYVVTANGATCTFPVTFVAAAPPAVFTLAGAPGACSAAVIAGTYAVSTTLGASNTVTIQVNVTTAGAYSITTNTVSGMTFSASGLFAATGNTNVILVGSGTPAASGSHVFTPQAGSSSCTFTIPVTGAATDYIRAKINGVLTNFNEGATADLDVSSGFPMLSIDGAQLPSTFNPSIALSIVKVSGGAITAGTYTVNQVAAGVLLGADYYDANNINFFAGTDPLNQAQTPGFNIVITSITSTRVSGTFSGTLKDNNGAGPGVKTVTEGAFSLPF